MYLGLLGYKYERADLMHQTLSGEVFMAVGAFKTVSIIVMLRRV